MEKFRAWLSPQVRKEYGVRQLVKQVDHDYPDEEIIFDDAVVRYTTPRPDFTFPKASLNTSRGGLVITPNRMVYAEHKSTAIRWGYLLGLMGVLAVSQDVSRQINLGLLPLVLNLSVLYLLFRPPAIVSRYFMQQATLGFPFSAQNTTVQLALGNRTGKLTTLNVTLDGQRYQFFAIQEIPETTAARLLALNTADDNREPIWRNVTLKSRC